MTFRVVIPARYPSTRLPGKPLRLLAGKPMVQHVYERACASGAAEVIVATDDDRVVQACRAFGAPVLLTDPNHPSGTDRLAEAARHDPAASHFSKGSLSDRSESQKAVS